jgi:predicted alpha/beta-hydrolase family hydrolase
LLNDKGRGEEPRLPSHKPFQIGTVHLTGLDIPLWIANGQRSILDEDRERVLQALKDGYKPQDEAEYLTLWMFL